MENIEQQFEENVSMEDLLDMSPEIETGEIITGEIISIDHKNAYINFGEKTEGSVDINEFETPVKVGDSVEVMMRSRKLQDGMFVLSHRAAVAIRQWAKFIEWYGEGQAVASGSVKNLTQSGAVIQLENATAFLPKSLAADIKLKDNAGTDSVFDFKILKVDERKRKILLSRRDFIDERKDEVWTKIISEYKEGDKVKGKVAKLVDFGVFVDIGGYDALLHNNDITWKKVYKRKSIIDEGDEKEFVIININKEDKKVAVGLKQLQEDPWLNFDKRYENGSKVSGVISTVTNFGFFMEIEDGIEGLVKESDIAWTKKAVNPKDNYKKGDSVDAMVLSFDKEERKLSLGVKQLGANPWDAIDNKYPVGETFSRTIKKIMNFGMFVELEENIDGMVHISDITWDDKVKNPTEGYKEGDKVDVKILKIDKAEMKISCGIKQLEKSPWEVVKEKYPARSEVFGKVVSIKPFGMFIRVDEDVEGFVHISEVSRKKIEDLEEFFKIGDSVKALVQNVDVAKKRLSLSIKHFEMIQEKEELDKIIGETSSNTYTIGDMFNLKGNGK